MATTKETLFEDKEFKLNGDSKRLRIIHFNDVYNIEHRQKDPCGGASRFVEKMRELMQDEPALVFFSGDAFSPSLLGSILKGKQMVDILNRCQITAACLGNHEFDYGVDVLADLVKASSYDWLLSNILDANSGEPLVGAKVKKIVEFNGVKIGIIGLGEEEWISTLATLDYDDLKYQSFLLAGKRLAQKLKKIEKCDIVVAVTHMRLENDITLTENAQEIDIVLGGHDHDYELKKCKDRWLVKSGADFRYLSYIEMNVDLKEKKSYVSLIDKYTINLDAGENIEIKERIDHYMSMVNAELDKVLGITKADLDGRFSKIRNEETNLGNFFCDIVMENVEADCCILNGGAFRSDTLHEAGPFKMRDLKAILPFASDMAVIAASGKIIHEALENGVCEWPSLEGRFPQVSGIKFEFDSSKPSGSRVDQEKIFINGKKIKLNKEYKLAVNGYILAGKDGYSMLPQCKVLVDQEYVPLLFSLIENHFKAVKQIADHTVPRSKAASSLVPLSFITSWVKEIASDSIFGTGEISKGLHKVVDEKPIRPTFKMLVTLIINAIRLQHRVLNKKAIKKSAKYEERVTEYEKKAIELAPVVEGRIINVDPAAKSS